MSPQRLISSVIVSVTLLGCDQALAPTDLDTPGKSSDELSMGKGGQLALATGSYRISAPEDVFGIVVLGRFTFNAHAFADGTVNGRYDYDETYPDDGITLTYRGRVTCFKVYDGNRAKIGGVIEESNDPLFPPGMFLWWSTRDNGHPTPDWSTFGGAGDETANEDFCNSPNLPRFGPFPLEQGNSNVKEF